MDNCKIGKFLAKLRKEKKLTQKQLAKLINCDNKTISKWETGVYSPGMDYLIKLSELYNISVSEIIKGEKNLNSNDLIASSNNKKNFKKNLKISKIFFLILMFVYFLLIFNINKNELELFKITCDTNSDFFVNGYMIYTNNKTVYDINDIQYNTIYNNTNFEPLLDEIDITLLLNNEIIFKITNSYDEPVPIHTSLQNISLASSLNKKITLKDNIKIIISYNNIDNTSKNIETLMLSLKNN